MKRKTKLKRRSKASASSEGLWVSPGEFARLRNTLREAKETLEAIRNGDVDALVVRGPRGDQVYSLAGADEPYRVYVERMQEGAVTISRDGLILYANQRFADMIGQPLERVISARASAYLGASAWDKICSVFTSQQEVVKCESILPRRRGLPLPVTLTASHLPLKGQNVLCLVVTDLSAQKQNEELRMAKEVAEKASLAKDTFLAALSHELRTPLNPVLMLASEAAGNPELPLRVRQDFAAICSNIELEARLIDDLLDLTRITHGKLLLATDFIDAHAILNSAIATIKPDLEAKHLCLTIDPEQKPCLVKADAVRLQQVFWNILKNAVKFTPEHGEIKISTRVIPKDKNLAVSISDTGIGMTHEELGQVFETFVQGDHAKGGGAHQFGGLGLGLSISKMIARMHSGDIRAQSRGRGKGSTFIIELPLADGPVDNTQAKEEHDLSRNRLVGAASSMNILLVEDHEPTRNALTRLLARRQHAVAVAATASEARRLAEKERFDLVISDIGLPDENGFDLMKDLNRRYNLKGIALTGYGSEQDVISSQNSGFVSHLTKPIRMDALEAALSNVMAEIRSSLLVS